MTYKLNLNSEQCRVLVRALDLYARVGLGQLEVIGEHLQHFAKKQDLLYYQMCDAFRELKPALTGLGENTSYGIGSDCVPEAHATAFDMMQVIRHKVAWDEHPEGGVTVGFNKPMRFGKEELPVMEKA